MTRPSPFAPNLDDTGWSVDDLLEELRAAPVEAQDIFGGLDDDGVDFSGVSDDDGDGDYGGLELAEHLDTAISGGVQEALGQVASLDALDEASSVSEDSVLLDSVEDILGGGGGDVEEPGEDIDTEPGGFPASVRESRSRRAMAARTRAAMDGRLSRDATYGAGWADGYRDALVHLGAPAEAVDEAFGILPLVMLLGKGVGAATKPIVEGATGKKEGEGAFKSLGQAIGEKLGLRKKERFDASTAGQDQVSPASAQSAAAKAIPLPPATASVEADRHELPPVYVADTKGFEEDLAQTHGTSSHGAMPIEERFGATAQVGFVGGQARRGAQVAAERAVQYGAMKMAATRPTAGSVFVEDGGARPLLFSDGTLWESVYGRLVACPCPSCAPVHFGALTAGSDIGCLVCDDYGAILVPETDLESYAGIRYGILLPLIAAAYWATQTEEGKKTTKDIGKKLKKKKSHKKKPHKKKSKKDKKGAETTAAAATATTAAAGTAGAATTAGAEALDETDTELSSLETETAADTDASAPAESASRSVESEEDSEEAYGVARALVPEAWARARYGSVW